LTPEFWSTAEARRMGYFKDVAGEGVEQVRELSPRELLKFE